MFMQSFENSDKQQKRRLERNAAMQRMQDAAKGLVHSNKTGGGDGGRGRGGVARINLNADEDEETIAFEDLSTVGQVRPSYASVVSKSNNHNDDHPWKTNSTNNDAYDGATAGNTSGSQAAAHSGSMSVTSASNFLRETQRQHELEHPHSPPNELPSLSHNHHHLYPPTLSMTVPTKMESNSAKQFLWDDQSSVISGRSGYSAHTSNSVNLHDIKNSFGGQNGGKMLARNKGQVGKGARWSAINNSGNKGTTSGGLFSKLPSIWGSPSRAGALDGHSSQASSNSSSKYRDEEGEHLLNLASNRLEHELKALQETSKEYGELEDDDDDSFLRSGNNKHNHRGGNHQESNFSYEGEHRRVFLDDQGNLSYDGSDVYKRRMRSAYQRALKRPVVLLCACAAFVGIIVGIVEMYENMTDGILGMVGNGSNGSMNVGENIAGEEWDETISGLIDNLNNFDKDGQTASNNGEGQAESASQGQGAETPAAQTLDKKEIKQRFDHLRATLIDLKASPPEVFLDTNSAQYAALVWLTKDDPRQMKPDSAYLGQRYGLAVLWFSTTKSGYDWHVPEELDYNDDEYEKYEKEEYDDKVDEEENEANGNENDAYEEFVEESEFDDDDEVDYGLLAEDEDVEDDDLDYDLVANDPDGYYYDDKTQDDMESNSDYNNRKHRQLRLRKLGTANDPNKWFRHDNWLSSMGICGWEGITCHPHTKSGDGTGHDGRNDGDVSRVELRRNNLHGLIPDELYTTLPYLRVLDISDNGMAGTLSPKISTLKGVEVLNFTANNIAGAITSEIGTLASLKELHVANNLLKEALPHTIGELSSLKHLDLSGNTIKGTIPYQIGHLSNLGTLNLSYNLLVGPIPHEFSELQTLVELDVSHNNLGGPIFDELSKVKYLERLIMEDNHFSGEVPGEIGSLIHLDELRLNNNDFKGTLPAEIAKLDGLDTLNVANNHFEGGFPMEWTTMAGLQELDISFNELRGEIPIFIDGMKNLRSLNMAHNDFSSTIPLQLGSLYKLEYLYLEDNEFEEKVPTELGELTNIKKMVLHNNYLVGEIDGRICKLVDELFLTHLSADCAGELPEIHCDCCQCHDHEPIVHVNNGS